MPKVRTRRCSARRSRLRCPVARWCPGAAALVVSAVQAHGEPPQNAQGSDTDLQSLQARWGRAAAIEPPHRRRLWCLCRCCRVLCMGAVGSAGRLCELTGAARAAVDIAQLQPNLVAKEAAALKLRVADSTQIEKARAHINPPHATSTAEMCSSTRSICIAIDALLDASCCTTSTMRACLSRALAASAFSAPLFSTAGL